MQENLSHLQNAVIKSPVQKKPLQDMPSDKELVNSSSPDENSHSECLKEDNSEKAEVKTERINVIESLSVLSFEKSNL